MTERIRRQLIRLVLNRTVEIRSLDNTNNTNKASGLVPTVLRP
jgi:hypothetical protein